MPTTFLRTSFYWDNLIHFGMGLKKGPDGQLAVTMPMDDRGLPGIAVRHAAFDKGLSRYKSLIPLE